VAAGSKPVEEFRLYDVEFAKSRGEGLWFGVRGIRRESVDSSFGAKRVGINSALIDCGEPVRIHDTAGVFREFATEPDRAVGRPAVIAKREHSRVFSELKRAAVFSERKHTAIVSERKHTAIVSEWQWQPFIFIGGKPAQFIRIIGRKRVQRRKRRQGLNASSELSRFGEPRRWRRRQRWWWWASLKLYQ
jgi:hypothetical protein